MIAHLISIGNELLIGDTVNTNASWLGQFLQDRGVQVTQFHTITDEPEQIKFTIQQALDKADLVISTGGLGPTLDDVTKKSIAELFGVGMRHEKIVEKHIKEFFHRRNLPYSKSNQAQSLIPNNAELLFNATGTAPGMLFTEQGSLLVVLPGVPHEMKHLMTTQVAPRLQDWGSLNIFETRYLKVAGIGESHLIDNWLPNIKSLLNESIDLAFLPSKGQVWLRLTGRGQSREEAISRVNSLSLEIKQRLGNLIYSDEKEDTLDRALGRILTQYGYRLATAESCTGGLMGHMLTETPGSSAYVQGGIIAYNNAIKMSQLGVDAAVIEQKGAVSAEVALQMAKGVAKRMDVECGISSTGVAGPGGGSPEKPVGTVWIGFFTPNQHFAVRAVFSNSRSLNKLQSVITGFEILRRCLLGMDELPYNLQKVYSDSLEQVDQAKKGQSHTLPSEDSMHL